MLLLDVCGVCHILLTYRLKNMLCQFQHTHKNILSMHPLVHLSSECTDSIVTLKTQQNAWEFPAFGPHRGRHLEINHLTLIRILSGHFGFTTQHFYQPWWPKVRPSLAVNIHPPIRPERAAFTTHTRLALFILPPPLPTCLRFTSAFINGNAGRVHACASAAKRSNAPPLPGMHFRRKSATAIRKWGRCGPG